MKKNTYSPFLLDNRFQNNPINTQFQQKAARDQTEPENPMWKKVKKNSARKNPNELGKKEGYDYNQNRSARYPGQKQSHVLANYIKLQNNGDSIEEMINPNLDPILGSLTPNLEGIKNSDSNSIYGFNDLENSDININLNHSFQAENQNLTEKIAKEENINELKENTIKEILTKAEKTKSLKISSNIIYTHLLNSVNPNEISTFEFQKRNQIDFIKSYFFICKKSLKKGKYESTLDSLIYLENVILKTLLSQTENLSLIEINQIGDFLMKTIKKENKALRKMNSFELMFF